MCLRLPTASRTRDLHFDTEDGQQLKWTFQIAEVNKVLASVSYLGVVDHNRRLVFDQDLDTGEDIIFIAKKTHGELIKMRRDRNVWVIDAYIEDDTEQGSVGRSKHHSLQSISPESTVKFVLTVKDHKVGMRGVRVMPSAVRPSRTT